MIKVIIVGRVGSIKLSQDGNWANLSLAVSNSKDADGKEQTTWVSVKCRNHGIIPFLRVGAVVCIESNSPAEPSCYQRQDGTWTGASFYWGDKIDLLSNPKGEQQSQQPAQQQATQPQFQSAFTSHFG